MSARTRGQALRPTLRVATPKKRCSISPSHCRCAADHTLPHLFMGSYFGSTSDTLVSSTNRRSISSTMLCVTLMLRDPSVVLLRGVTFPVTSLTQGSIRLLGRAPALCILGQGEAEDGLPERLIGGARIVKPDLGQAELLDW